MSSRRPAARSRPCPNCGEPVPPGALACRECGSDAETGWSDETYLDGVDLPDDESYEDFLERELGLPAAGRSARRRWGRTALIWVLVLVLAAPVVIVMLWILRSLLNIV